MQDKKTAREKARILLREWGKNNRPAADEKMAGNLSKFINQQKLFSIQGSGVIGIFAPLASEPQWTLPSGPGHFPRLAFPKMQESAMTFHRCQLGELVLGHQNLNILEAPEKAQMVMPDMLVIPGLAFSWKGERLGRGKGYYDCYLERYQGIKVALSFSVTTWDELPVESHDQRVDWLITEQGIFDCQRGVWAFDTE